MFEKITEIATFSMYKTEEVDYWIYGLTEDDKVPFNTNFELAGHDSNLFILSIGAPWYYLIVMIEYTIEVKSKSLKSYSAKKLIFHGQPIFVASIAAIL